MKKSVREGSFFSQSKLPILTLLKLCAYWSVHPSMTYEEIKTNIGPNSRGELLSLTTLVDWYNFIRDIAEEWYELLLSFSHNQVKSYYLITFAIYPIMYYQFCRCTVHTVLRTIGGPGRGKTIYILLGMIYIIHTM